MPTEQFANNASASLVSAMSTSQTTMQVSSNDGFPSVTTASTNFFYVIVDQEIFKVTDNSTVTWIVSRGEQSTTPTTHANGSTVYHVVTKQSMIDIQTAANSVTGSLYGTYAALPASGTSAGQIYYTSDSFYSFRWNGSAWQAFAFNRPVTIPPESSTFTWLNQGTSTVTDSFGNIDLSVQSVAATTNVRGMLKSYSTPFTLELAFLPTLVQQTSTSAGFIVKNSGGNPLVYTSIYTAATSGYVQAGKHNSTSSFNSNYTGFIQVNFNILPVYMKYIDNGTNKTFQISLDLGLTYITVGTATTSDFVTPNQVGFAAESQISGVNGGMKLIHWKES
jgi:hypothetical protein